LTKKKEEKGVGKRKRRKRPRRICSGKGALQNGCGKGRKMGGTSIAEESEKGVGETV